MAGGKMRGIRAVGGGSRRRESAERCVVSEAEKVRRLDASLLAGEGPDLVPAPNISFIYDHIRKDFIMENQIEAVRALPAYRLTEAKRIQELNADGMILEHKKTGAKLFLLSAEDENKVFCIGFRTPPADSTGVPHILEHSVLCGSEKFPVKDPFVELVKGSLNTFLNAMTYPDKTVSPVAS